ncbi:hypothetical protein TKK_0010277 [Trichogramma kaykai]
MMIPNILTMNVMKTMRAVLKIELLKILTFHKWISETLESSKSKKSNPTKSKTKPKVSLKKSKATEFSEPLLPPKSQTKPFIKSIESMKTKFNFVKDRCNTTPSSYANSDINKNENVKNTSKFNSLVGISHPLTSSCAKGVNKNNAYINHAYVDEENKMIDDDDDEYGNDHEDDTFHDSIENHFEPFDPNDYCSPELGRKKLTNTPLRHLANKNDSTVISRPKPSSRRSSNGNGV